jgi:hypothetical protein
LTSLTSEVEVSFVIFEVGFAPELVMREQAVVSADARNDSPVPKPIMAVVLGDGRGYIS